MEVGPADRTLAPRIHALKLELQLKRWRRFRRVTISCRHERSTVESKVAFRVKLLKMRSSIMDKNHRLLTATCNAINEGTK